MKENVIIGKLIPAGTGMRRYRNVKLSTDKEESVEVSDNLTQDVNEPLSPEEIFEDPKGLSGLSAALRAMQESGTEE